jgi:isopenicillin-N N-acyltransferase-like protein
MTVRRFESSEHDPRRRGLAFGHAWRSEIASTFARYSELFSASGSSPAQVRAWGEQALVTVGDWCPPLATEMSAIATGSGLPAWQIGALNARTEILAASAVRRETAVAQAEHTPQAERSPQPGRISQPDHAPQSGRVSPAEPVSPAGRASWGECSTAVHLPGAGRAPRTLQTWDWHDHLRDVRLLWAYEPQPGHRVRTFTELGVLAKIGLNSRGLGVHFNFLEHASDTDQIGVPVHLVARRILDEAHTVDEARDIAASARTSASTALTVVGFHEGHADAVCLELSPSGLGEVRPEQDGTFVRTNHFLDPELARGDRVFDHQDSRNRLAVLSERRPALRSADLTDRAGAMLSHASDGAALCAHPAPDAPISSRWETLITISLDLEAARLEFHEGGPCAVAPQTWQSF